MAELQVKNEESASGTNNESDNMRLIVKTRIEWINAPNFLIKGFIEKDLAASNVKMGKYLRSTYSL